MSTDTGTGRENRRGARETPFRYGAALAEQIEQRWQDRWEREGTFRGARPRRAGQRAREGVPARHVPLPLGRGAARRAPAGLHRHGRPGPLPAHDRPQRAARDGFRRLRPARRAVRGADGHAPARHHRGQRHPLQGAAAPAGPGPRRAPLGRDHGRRLLPLDPVDLPADLRLVLRRGAAPRPADRGAGGGVRRGHPPDPRRAAVAGAVRGRAARRDRLVPAGLRLGGAGELVPRAGHGAGERGGHRGRAQRARELPRVPPQPEAVDDADHRVRRPAGRGPGPAGLAGFGQGDAAQLDRPVRGRAGAVRRRRCPGRRSRSSPPARTRCSAPPTWSWRPSTRWSSRSSPAPGRWTPTHAGRPAAADDHRADVPVAAPIRPREPRAARARSPSWTARRTRTRPASSPAPWP